VETAAQGVFDARIGFPDATLADLYNPLTMPVWLVKCPCRIGPAVDLLLPAQCLFRTTGQRVEHLFVLYEKLTAPLIVARQERPTKKH